MHSLLVVNNTKVTHIKLKLLSASCIVFCHKYFDVLLFQHVYNSLCSCVYMCCGSETFIVPCNGVTGLTFFASCFTNKCTCFNFYSSCSSMILSQIFNRVKWSQNCFCHMLSKRSECNRETVMIVLFIRIWQKQRILCKLLIGIVTESETLQDGCI